MAACVASSNLGSAAGTYLYALAAFDDSALAVIGSDDSLRIFDGSLNAIRNTHCHSGVTCLQAADRSHIITGGRDGSIRIWDTRAQKALEITDPKSNGISSIACQDHHIATGTESLKEGLGDVSVSVYDTRNPTAPLRQFTDSHTDTITQVKFHPSKPNTLLSGSTDGLVSLFDLSQAEEEDALRQVLNPRSAVHCAGFLTNDLAYVVSTDEQYSIYQLARTDFDDEQLPPPIEFGDVRAQLGCMYVVDVLIQGEDAPPLMAHGHNERQKLAISSLGKPGAWSFGPQVDLPGAHGEEVVRDVLVRGSRAFSCGEDGLVKVWSLGR